MKIIVVFIRKCAMLEVLGFKRNCVQELILYMYEEYG